MSMSTLKNTSLGLKKKLSDVYENNVTEYNISVEEEKVRYEIIF